MAHIWTYELEQWRPAMLDRPGHAIHESPPHIRPMEQPAGSSPRIVLEPAHGQWVLMAPADCGVRVNGDPLRLGIQVLNDRDLIRLGEQTLWFSTETLARIVAYGGAEIPCARCGNAIKAGDPAVRCPKCGTWHHQADDLDCWTCQGTPCAKCDQDTSLGADYRFRPEEV